jgi:3-isopropylmalate/(R)-2-methylmalate dehydratase large subunit
MQESSITYSILQANTKQKVEKGKIILLDVDRIMIHDGTGPVVAATLEKYDITELSATDKTVLMFDHYFPAKTSREAFLQKKAREFSEKYNIPLYQGKGISHHILSEKSLIRPGTVLVGGDSHTCTSGAFGIFASGYGATDIAGCIKTGKLWLEVPEVVKVKLIGHPDKNANAYDMALKIVGTISTTGALSKVVEFFGPALEHLEMQERMKISNFAVETGALSGIFDIDEICEKWCDERNIIFNKSLMNCGKNNTSWDYEIDIGNVEKIVAKPSKPDLIALENEVKQVKVDQVFIGSCSAGFFKDIKLAAEKIKGRKVAENVRLLICPATEKVLNDALKAGYIQMLIDAGAVILPPGCGSCLGNIGALADGEVSVATQNRNFTGRVGSKKAKIYLASAETAIEAAISGKIGEKNDY